jgi:hypothetical protein
VTTEPTGPEEDEPIERTLQAGLSRTALTDEAYARMHAAVAAEWQTVVRARPRTPSRRWLAVVSGLAAALIVATVLVSVFSKKQSLGVIARPLELRSTLSVGKVLVARAPVLVELRDGGSLRIAPGAQFEVTGADEVFLRRGEIYTDLPPNIQRASTFVVRTPFGLVEHLGTQFDVAVNGELRIRVREGSVRLRRGSQTETAVAGTELVVPRVGTPSRRSTATRGPEWSWVEALEPDYPIENRRLADFLQWAARETGARLHFQDEHAREVAERTRLHGSVQGLSATQALETVFATTSLRYNFEQDRIEVSSGS